MNDTERLDWLEKQFGCGLISDDAGHWAFSGEGMQNVPDNPPQDIQTTFFIEAKEWKPSIRESIDATIAEYTPKEGGDEKCPTPTMSRACNSPEVTNGDAITQLNMLKESLQLTEGGLRIAAEERDKWKQLAVNLAEAYKDNDLDMVEESIDAINKALGK